MERIGETLAGYADRLTVAPGVTLRFMVTCEGATRYQADIVFYETSNGGAVFAVGSIGWQGSLSHEGYANNVAKLTDNIARRFVDEKPF